MMNDGDYTKWVACWGNATSITDRREAVYSKDLTIRYPVKICFSGKALRFWFSNWTGTEPVTLTMACVAESISDREIDETTAAEITFDGSRSVTILPGQEVCSDAVCFPVRAGMTTSVSMYFADYTQMNAGVLITGPLSKGFFSYGNYAVSRGLPLNRTRTTSWFYFLNTVEVLTEEKNRALICYGDSITAQSWPDYLAIRAWEQGYHNTAVIRRAVSGTRILREYDCITYAAYGIKGETRFPLETKVAGADTVLIQHGINDIIHPVGADVNPFRPWSDLPTADELIDGMRMYIQMARKEGLKVYGGTLLPIYGWRTYAPFREELKGAFNEWLRTTDELDGCVDFDRAICDPEHPEAFAPGYDSGDHLHPSESAYKRMAEEVPVKILK